MPLSGAAFCKSKELAQTHSTLRNGKNSRAYFEADYAQIAMAPRPLLTLSMLALCGVCRAYQAATGRIGTPASQVTMMAKSKVRRGPAAAAASAELPRGALL